MKSSFIHMVSIFLLAVVAATITWFARGGVKREMACDPADIPPQHVCLQTLIESNEYEEVLWLDARSRKEFEEGHLEGAHLLTMHYEESWDDLLAEVAEKIVMAPKVIIYCASAKCGSSKEVVERLLEVELNTEVYALFGGWHALQGAGKVPIR